MAAQTGPRRRTPSETERFEGTRIKSADRTLGLIELIAERGSIGFGDVIDALGLPRSSAHGLLKTLSASGWIRHDDRRREYTLGLRAWQIGQCYRGHTQLIDVAKPLMDRLVEQLGETVQLAQLDGIDNVYIAIAQPSRAMRLVSSVGARLEAHATGIGKVLLSQLPTDEARSRLGAQPLSQLTPNTVVDLDRLLELLAAARDFGYALDDEEYISGCRCVAVPVTSESDGIGLYTAMSVTMPTSRTDQHWPTPIIEPLQRTADEIRRQLGLTED